MASDNVPLADPGTFPIRLNWVRMPLAHLRAIILDSAKYRIVINLAVRPFPLCHAGMPSLAISSSMDAAGVIIFPQFAGI